MFESTRLKLTLVYMGILTAICIFFSYNWYTIATNELDQSVNQQRIVLQSRHSIITKDVVNEIIDEAQERYQEARNSIINRIIATDILIIAAGTIGSYLLAKKSLEPIEQAHREQIRFTADASHELRTPLASMKTEIEVALRDPKLNKLQAISQLHSNIEELDKLTSLSDGLLMLARQSESVDINLKNVSIEAIINKAISQVEKTAKHKNVKLVHRISDMKVSADFDSISELFVILLDNAIKYSPADSTVTIKSKASSSKVNISIIDSGIGVAKAEQEHIFDRFYRADNSRSSQNVKGNGLGLSIAQNIAEIHNSQIVISSEGKNRGSEFSIKLDRAAKKS